METMSPPPSRTSSTVASAGSTVTSQPTTDAPSRANASAVARPMLPAVPVITHTLPASRRRSSSSTPQIVARAPPLRILGSLVLHACGMSGKTLVGRERECAVLDGLVSDARAARGGVLVLQGEAGVGKTALLEYAIEAGPEFRVARAVGVEAEMELPFAAVQQLCAPFLPLRERLPQPQHDALEVAFGLRTGAAPDRFLVGLAVLGLLAEAAEEQALACAVDDAQWLDSASARTLAFVGRRLVAEKIALVFATRELGETLSGLPELQVNPLARRDARALLDSVLPARLDERVLDRIVAETRGNPLALLELPRGLSPTQLAGGFGLPTTAPLSAGIEDRYTRRLAKLPSHARRLLLVAAADPVGDPALVWRAGGRRRGPGAGARPPRAQKHAPPLPPRGV